MVAKKTSNKVTKKVVKKPAKKANKKVQVVSQSIKSNKKTPKSILTTTNVDTSTPVNKWVGPTYKIDYDWSDIGFTPHEEDLSDKSNKEHKLFEIDNVEKPEEKFPFWLRVLWWFVK